MILYFSINTTSHRHNSLMISFCNSTFENCVIVSFLVGEIAWLVTLVTFRGPVCHLWCYECLLLCVCCTSVMYMNCDAFKFFFWLVTVSFVICFRLVTLWTCKVCDVTLLLVNIVRLVMLCHGVIFWSWWLVMVSFVIFIEIVDF